MGPDEATVVSLEGRMYPVEVAYLQEPTPDYVRKAAEVAYMINKMVRRLYKARKLDIMWLTCPGSKDRATYSFS